MNELAQSSDVSVAVRVQTHQAIITHSVPGYTLATLEGACRLTLGVFGVALLMVGTICRVLAEPLSVAGRTALILAKGDE